MSNDIAREPMLDMFIFETQQLIEQLEQEILTCEKSGRLDLSINEIFRIMHTIKGSAAMMVYNNIATLAHSIEDLFFFIREKKPVNVDTSTIFDIILAGSDFIKNEIAKIENGSPADGSPDKIIQATRDYLDILAQAEPANSHPVKNKPEKTIDTGLITTDFDKTNSDENLFTYQSVVFFEDGCEMENIRSFVLINNLKQAADVISIFPTDIAENNLSADIIKKEGFRVIFRTSRSFEEIKALFEQTVFLKSVEITPVDNIACEVEANDIKNDVTGGNPNNDLAAIKDTGNEKNNNISAVKQSMISVSVAKLDKLMDMVGELVISESMVIHNPELKDLQLEGFLKAARQLHKITGELQDIVMSIRMVPLSVTFQKMNRIVRDMSRKLEKDVKLEIIGEETEVDKNIIEHISDPLMHLIRNSIDHGIESSEERLEKGKPETGTVILEAKNSGGDVWITVKDDGRGLNKEKILKKAIENGLTNKTENELTEKEIFSFILLPGFSTNDEVTEFSGRGVGMDVVVKNIGKIGGTVVVDSVSGKGTTVTVKIPLTLAIIDGMVVQVGAARYIIPTVSIKQSFKLSEENVITDESGNEMIMVRGSCYPVLRLHKYFNVKTDLNDIHDGIIVMVENNEITSCVLADYLLGEQQVVVKALPGYIKKVRGVSGCTLLGDGGIGLILDTAGLLCS